MNVQEKKRKGRLEKRYLDQALVLSPPIRQFLRQFTAAYGHNQSALESALESVQPYMTRPIRFGDLDNFTLSFILSFIRSAAVDLAVDCMAPVDACEVAILATSASARVLHILDSNRNR